MDYGHPLLFGVFITPTSDDPQRPVELALTAEDAGLDLVTFQDHPYQPALLDAWTLLSYVAARTDRIHLAGNVLNLPLRPPAVLARAAAGLDRLTGGRVEMTLGAGGFFGPIKAMGGPELSPGQARRGLAEGIEIMREIWDVEQRGGVRLAGTQYTVDGAKRGPAPAHDIPIWVGALGPKMLELVGTHADGWLPSLSYLPGGLAGLPLLNTRIDDAARGAGRQPSDIRRLINLGGAFADEQARLLSGPPEEWAAELAWLTAKHGITGFILAADDAETIEVFGSVVAPATRALVAAARQG